MKDMKTSHRKVFELREQLGNAINISRKELAKVIGKAESYMNKKQKVDFFMKDPKYFCNFEQIPINFLCNGGVFT